jgi:hypothetical protein
MRTPVAWDVQANIRGAIEEERKDELFWPALFSLDRRFRSRTISEIRSAGSEAPRCMPLRDKSESPGGQG